MKVRFYLKHWTRFGFKFSSAKEEFTYILANKTAYCYKPNLVEKQANSINITLKTAEIFQGLIQGRALT